MSTSISAENALNSYSLFNATSIKSFIIEQLQSGNEELFKDVDYLGSNMNAFIDIIAVMLQQILFHLSVNSSETTFSSAVLYESMSKLVSILGYKPVGKQTSMLPVQFTVTFPEDNSFNTRSQFTIPKFLTINYNSNYVLSADINEEIDSLDDGLIINGVLYQGSIQEAPLFTAIGDEFETFVINDNNIEMGTSFITDNFFTVFVKENGSSDWEEWTETTAMYLENSSSKTFEKRFNENYNYEFKFGNGTYGKKLTAGDQIAIYYLISNGETASVSDGIITSFTPSLYASSQYTQILNSIYKYDLANTLYTDVEYITVSNTGPSTAIAYPESVESMRNNAPKIFSSQNRLFTLIDYETFINKYFSEFCKDIYMMTNTEYVSSFLDYYYKLGVDCPQEDSRINIAQVEFMTSVNFNNIYGVIVPKVNTIIDGTTPNYLNTSLKQQIVTKAEPYKGITHNLVPLDPVYRAFTWGSPSIDYDYYNSDQLQNILIVERKSSSKYSIDYIKETIMANLISCFDEFTIGSSVSISDISAAILNAPGIDKAYIQDINGNTTSKLCLYYWNPLYSSEDCGISYHDIYNESFIYPYFYDVNNISNVIKVIDNN